MKTNTIIALAAGAAVLACMKKKQSVSGVGGVLWDYALMECEQKGIDLSKNYYSQPYSVLEEIGNMRRKFGYHQSASSKAMGRTDRYSFYLALQRRAGF